MDSFEMNKVLGAILGTCLAVLSSTSPPARSSLRRSLAKPGYEIAVPEKPPARSPPSRPRLSRPIAELLAKADVARGENAAQKCAACHTFNKGGRPLVGPNLWGVVGRPKAHEAGFNYSAALKAKGGNWTVDESEPIHQPTRRRMIPGTTMTFAGISRRSERADIIAYLNSLSDNPKPLPKGRRGPAGAPKAAGQRAKAEAPAAPKAQ